MTHLPKSTLDTLNAGMDALQQDQARKNVEDALKDKDVLALAEAVAMFNLSQIREEIALGIKVNVNGKIDKMQAGLDAHNAKHEEDMVRIMPALEYVEKQIRFTEDAATSGKVILWISGFIVSLGAAWLMVIKVLHS